MADNFTVSTVSGNVVIRSTQLGTGEHLEWVVHSGTDGFAQLVDSNGHASVRVENIASVKAIRSSTTTMPTPITASTSSTVLAAADANRLGIVIRNNSTAVLYIRDNASVVTAANATLALDAGGVYANYLYNGEIRGIWAAANGTAVITIYTA